MRSGISLKCQPIWVLHYFKPIWPQTYLATSLFETLLDATVLETILMLILGNWGTVR